MYLLMLLATFISAIYGFNLSARPDYDRDVAKKKAMGIVYRFSFQEKTAVALLKRINLGSYKGTAYPLQWALPGDKIYADYLDSDGDTKGSNEDTTLFYEADDGSSPQPFYMRKMKGQSSGDEAQVGKAALADDYLESGKHFFDGFDMVTKALCLDRAMQKSGAKACEPTPSTQVDEEGKPLGYIDTCCNIGFNYVVSYKKLDPRWINRIHKGISLDFMNAIVSRDYTDNIGVIHWDGDKECKNTKGDVTSSGCWVFQGKINFLPVYADEMEAWEDEHRKEDGTKEYFPSQMRDKGGWDLPLDVFPHNFFTDKEGGTTMCEKGCLFKIRTF